MILADIRFPSERANGVQIVKTAAALAGRGVETLLVVRRSDPRPTREILGLFGLEAEPTLSVDRARVFHRTGSFVLPRLSFLAQAGARSFRHLIRGGITFTRDLQLADILVRAGARRVVYEAHAVESLMYEERGAIYGTAEEADPRKTARIAAREARVWQKAAGFVTTTSGIRATFEALHGPRSRVRVVPNGCDVPRDRVFSPPPVETPPRVLYAGQLYPWKGVDVLVRAMARVPEARLVILGGLEGEADMGRIRSLVDALGLGERIEMPGTVPQAHVAAELRRAAVVAVPFLKTAMTERHTSPLKAFEAMAAGRPIVATDVPATREVLEDGKSALLVPPADEEALGAAMRLLLEDRALASRLARNAWDLAPRYAWEARAGALAGLLEEVP